MQITRKLVYLILYAMLASCLTSSLQSNEQELTKRPNILFFLVDDQRNDILSCEGHPIVKTPTVDMLAQKGVRFTNAFVTTSICTASRASILTGLFETKHQFTFGKDPIKSEFVSQSYPYLLKTTGYATGFIGKFGVKIEHQDSLIKQMFDYFEPAPQSTPYFDTLKNEVIRHSSEIKGDQAVTFIKNQTTDKPFCLSISFNAVHAVDDNLTPGNNGHYPYPKAVSHLYENLEMPKPKLSDPEIFENHPDFMKHSLHTERFKWRWDTPQKYQTNLRAYFRMISGYDNVMKRVINALEENGLDENTIIVFSSDNGYYMGNRGFAGKWSHYEESLRVPLIIYDPRAEQKQSNYTSDKIALNIDIAATILDYAGIPIPSVNQGKSLLAIMDNQPDENWRQSFFCEHRYDHNQIPKYKGIRGKRYVYANYYEQVPPYEYLHDLEKDPDQLINLAENPEHQNLLYDMRDQTEEMERSLK